MQAIPRSTVGRSGFCPCLEKVFCKHKRPVGSSWRMDETCIKLKGVWKYLYRAVDKEGKTVDFLLTAKRDKAATRRFFDKLIKASGVPEKVTRGFWLCDAEQKRQFQPH